VFASKEKLVAKPSIRLSREVRDKASDADAVARAALAAFEAAGRGEIHFARFTAAGKQFALSTRMVIEVDWLPGRVPDKVLRGPVVLPARQKKKAQRT
jgi:hypothetical protein